MDIDLALERLQSLTPEEISKRNLALLRHDPLFDLELSSACNIACSFCPRDEMIRTHKLMDEETFSAILQFLPDNAIVMLSGLGDALVHPQLSEMVRRLSERGLSSCVITNGVRLTPTRQDALIEAGIAEIQVSVHGLDEETVRRVIPRGAQPALVRANVERLATRGGVRLRINFVETPDNRGERARVEAWAHSLQARFFYRRQHTRGGTISTVRGQPSHRACGIFASVTFVSSDGNIFPCVNDVRGADALGNIRTLTWEDVLVWKRQTISEGRWFAACKKCNDDYRYILLANDGLQGA